MFKKKHFSLEIVIDDEFDGIIYGSSDNPSGCKLKGKLVLIGKKSIKIKALTFLFIGRATVSCGPPLSSSRPEYSEVEEILQKKCIFHQADGSQHKVPAGVHEYHFEYDLPPNLPPSFKGTRGKIEYSCHAILERPLFSNDVMVKKEVTIKRCLINDVSTSHPQQLSSFTENTLDEKIYYQIDSPIISFREGGLVSLELLLKPLKSDISIEFVEYGLKERINYRTTGERAMSVIANVDEDRFPLGKKLISIDPSSHNHNHNHNDIGYDSSVISINFRLCPWVNNDIESQLINVSHKLSFTIGYKEKVSGLTMFEVESNFGGDACDTHATTFARNNRRFSTPVNRSSLLQNDVGAGRIRSVMNNRRSMNFGIYRHRDNNNDVHGERNASDDDGHNGNVNSTINSDTNDNNNNNNNNNNDDNNNNNNNNHRTQRDSVSNGINNFRRSFNLVSYLNSNNNNNLRKSITHSSGVIKRSRRIRFEIPIIITSKPSKPIQQAPDYSVDDEPPAYIYSTMIPSPPEYAVSTTNHYNRSTIIIHYENDDDDD